MVRLVLISLTMMVVLSLSAFAQGTAWPTGSFVVGVGADGGVPTGDFSNASSFGIGGTAVGGYLFDPNAMVYLRAGYIHFSGKDVTVLVGFDPNTLEPIYGTESVSWSVVPILAGGRYYFIPPGDMRVYGGAELGIYNLSASVSGSSSSTSSTKFGVAPTLGAQFKAGDKMDVDVHVNYSIVFTDVSNTSWVGFGVGLLFDLAQ